MKIKKQIRPVPSSSSASYSSWTSKYCFVLAIPKPSVVILFPNVDISVVDDVVVFDVVDVKVEVSDVMGIACFPQWIFRLKPYCKNYKMTKISYIYIFVGEKRVKVFRQRNELFCHVHFTVTQISLAGFKLICTKHIFLALEPFIRCISNWNFQYMNLCRSWISSIFNLVRKRAFLSVTVCQP